MEFLRRLCCCYKPLKPYRHVPARLHRLSNHRKQSTLIGSRYLSAKLDIAKPYTSDAEDSTDDEYVNEDSAVQQEVNFRIHEGRIVATRARYTYGLDGYDKNAMLVLAQTEPQERELVEKRVDLLKRSFQQFSFEVDVQVDLGPGETEAQLEEFFSRDFSGVGAVCVAVVGGAAETGQLLESRVLSRLTAALPAALAGRPRVYITELARTGAAVAAGVYSLPLTSQYPDIIAIHIPTVIEGDSNPLQMLCDRLGTQRDFKAEVMAAVHEAETTFPILAEYPIQVDSTLTLELELVKRASSPRDGSSADGNNLPNGDNQTLAGAK